MSERRSLTGFVPPYACARRYIEILNGESVSQFRVMRKDIDRCRGSQKKPTNWKKPDQWIPKRLEGDSRRLALKIWIKSNGAINPAHLKGYISICHCHSLLKREEGTLTLTQNGRLFLEANVEFMMQMDRYEGMFLILNDLLEKGPGQSLDILDRHRRYCLKCTGWQSEKSISTSHVQRLQNLAHRGYIAIDGYTYWITAAGRRYLRSASQTRSIEPPGYLRG